MGESWIAFGSELTVFKHLPHLTLTLSRKNFAHYVEFGYLSGEDTILNEVQALRPGHFATWQNSQFESRAFWKLPDQPASGSGDQEAAVGAIEEKLRDAVACRLISDVPLGCFLSGGIDSSLIAALAKEARTQPLETYSIGFSDSEMDESQHAARIAKHLGTSHHQFLIKGESVLGEFTDILARAPEPLGDDSFIPTFVISSETRRHVTVALSGDGGDELFAGYSKYQQFVSARKLRAFSPVCALLARLPWPDKTQKRFDALAAGDPSELARWLSTLWKKRELNALLHNRCGAGDAPDFFSSAWNRRSSLDEIERFMLLDMETYLAGDILVKVDRASMAVGLEVRCPFLDQELFDCVFRWRMQSGSKVDGKQIQKRLLARYVPPELFERPKQGFGLPITDWYRGPLREVLLEYTRPERIRQRGLLDEKSLGNYINAHLSGRRNFARKLHAIVAFEVWADTFFGTNTTVN